MPVTEPPWVNIGNGTAGRNGTTSHTIDFGFTSTSGNLLVVCVYGAVTHAAAGWTMQLSPVSSGQLSVFTKTSSGDSSITLTHNGSNFPVQWLVYEFAHGSTYSSGTSSTPTSDTFPTLSSLPGTPQVIVAARGRDITDASSASSSWGSPWVKDADLSTVGGTTDGAYLSVAHQINYTGTSITASATTTYTGAGFPADREHAVFAINAVAAPTGATYRPNAGTTTRPTAGTTYRQYAGLTARP